MMSINATSFTKNRELLYSRDDCRFVKRHEFSELLISRRHLVRENPARADVMGLMDPETGARFLIERERFLSEE